MTFKLSTYLFLYQKKASQKNREALLIFLTCNFYAIEDPTEVSEMIQHILQAVKFIFLIIKLQKCKLFFYFPNENLICF